MALDGWFLRQDIVERLLSSGSENDEALAFGDRIMRIAAHDGAEHQALSDPIDRSIALVLSLVREEGLNAWDIDLEAFLEIFTERVRTEADRVDLPACGRLIRLAWEVLHEQTLGVYDRATAIDMDDEDMEGIAQAAGLANLEKKRFKKCVLAEGSKGGGTAAAPSAAIPPVTVSALASARTHMRVASSPPPRATNVPRKGSW